MSGHGCARPRWRSRRFIWYHLPTVLVVGLLPLILLSALWFGWYRHRHEQRVMLVQGAVVETLATVLQTSYQEHARQAAEVAQRVAREKLYRDPEALQRALVADHRLTGGFVLAFHDLQGLGIAGSRSVAPYDIRTLKVNIAARPAFQEAVARNTPVVSSFVKAYVTDFPVAVFMWPVAENGRVVGVVTLLIALQDMERALRAHAPRGAGQLFLLDRFGTAYHVDPKTGRPALTDWRDSPLTAAIRDGGRGVRRLTADGVDQVVSWATMPVIGVVVGVRTPMAQALARGQSAIAKGLLLGTGLLVALSLITAVVSGSVARRELDRLRAYLRNLASASPTRDPEAPAFLVSELSDVADDARRMADAIRQRQEELEIFHALDHALASANEAADVVRLAVPHVLPLLSFDAAAAFTLDERTRELRLFHEHALPPALAAAARTIPADRGLVHRVVVERAPLVVALDVAREDLPTALRDAAAGAGFVTLATTPLAAHGTVYGVLSLLSRRPIAPSDRTMSLLSALGTEIGLAVAHAVERERVVAQDRLAALGRLAAGTAHELKNPLAVLGMRLAIVAGETRDGVVPSGPDMEQHLATLTGAVERMRRIVNGLSTYGKPPSPEPAVLDVRALLETTRDLVRHEAARHDVVLDVDGAATPLPAIRGDRSQLMQVLLNLVTNGIEAASGPGGRVALRASAGDGGVVRIDVVDNGVPIPADILPRIWEPFFTTKPEGSGLGLSIVRSLVASQPGAAVSVDTGAERGTTFSLTFPAVTLSPAGGAARPSA